MMTLLQQYGLTRTKLFIVLGLGALLVGVWGNALLGGSSQKNTRSARRERPKATASKETAKADAAEAKSDTPTRRPARVLPAADIADVTRNDPFARPRWAVDEAAAARRVAMPSLSEREALLEELSAEGVTIVMMAGNKKLATVGGKRVRPGDTLSGFRVIDITTAGVVLSEQPVDEAF